MSAHDNPLSRAVSEAWSMAQTNEEATERLLAIMQSDQAVYALAMAPHERAVAARLVAERKIARRHYIWTRPSAPDARVAALTRVNAVSLLDMQLPSGKRLGDATREEVEAAAMDYSARAKFNADKAGFLTAVLRKMKSQQTVAAAWTAAELEEIRNA
ncbi:MAG: hypothetical protein KGL63_01690 [Betaproteobacteria bacterium]|nr:hypothetical protein [Betaproteobacteria bacterium]